MTRWAAFMEHALVFSRIIAAKSMDRAAGRGWVPHPARSCHWRDVVFHHWSYFDRSGRSTTTADDLQWRCAWHCIRKSQNVQRRYTKPYLPSLKYPSRICVIKNVRKVGKETRGNFRGRICQAESEGQTKRSVKTVIPAGDIDISLISPQDNWRGGCSGRGRGRTTRRRGDHQWNNVFIRSSWTRKSCLLPDHASAKQPQKFAQSDITRTLLVYLERYKEFESSENMKRVVNLMHRQVVKAKAEGLYFQVSICQS